MGPLTELLVAAIADPALREAVRMRSPEDVLDRALAEARAACVGFAVADATVLGLTGRWLAGSGRAELLDEQPDKLTELAVAAACDARNPAALRAFEARYFTPLGALFGKMRLSPTLADEARQQLRVSLFVGTDGTSRLGHYAVGGELAGLVRVAATRAALSLLRKQTVSARDDDDLVALISPSQGPELRVARAEHREALREALQSALAALSSRDRTVLRMHLIDRLNIDEVGRVYRVHRSTAARWLERIRDELDASTRAHLGTNTRIAPDELPSLLAASHSELDLSLERILSPTSE